MPTVTLVAAVLLLLSIVLYQLQIWWRDSTALKHIPTHEFEDGDDSRKRYVTDLKTLLESGYRKYNKRGQAFKVRVRVGGYRIKYRVILPTYHLDEIKHLSNNTFSWKLASHVIFAGDYTGAPERGPWSGKALRVGIHQNLGDITRQLDRQTSEYFRTHLTQDPRSPQSVNLIDFFVPAIGTVNNTMLVDERLSADPEWVRETCKFASNRYKAADDVSAWPPYLATIVAPLLSSVRQLKSSKAMVRERLAPLYNDFKARDLLDNREREKRRKGSFGYEWLWGGAPENVTLNDFADTMMRTLIASIHTTAKTVSIALIDLLSQPEYLEELREEARSATAPNGEVDVDKLIRLDCFLKESQRFQPVFLSKSSASPLAGDAYACIVTMNRIVTRPYAFKSSDLELPAGTMTSAATAAVATDPSTFSNPNAFDGRRFFRLREDNKAAESHYNMGMATEDSLGFGLGSQACPARFFATVQMKLMFSKLLVGWDMALEKDGQPYHGRRPEMQYFDFSIVAPTPYGVRLTKR